MKPSGSFLRAIACVAGGGALFFTAGCGNMFVAKHKVLVDAISAPGAVKPSGQSYRLVAKKSVVAAVQAQVSVVKACVDAALAGQGMFEAPASAAPDVFIEVGYGYDTSGRVDPTTRETFLQLSARSNADRVMDRGTGPELWDVRVAVLGVVGRLETAMPLLCAVAANYLATDTHMETKIEIPQNAPMIVAVRETAIKSLEEQRKSSRVAPGAPALGDVGSAVPAADAAAAANARASVTPVK